MAGHVDGHRRPHLNGRFARSVTPATRHVEELGYSASKVVRDPISRTVSSLAKRTSCKSGDDSNECEKPVSGSTGTVAITICVVIAAVIALCVLIYLHRRNKKKVAQEDNDDKYKSMDFGLGEGIGGKKRKSRLLGGGEKSSHNKGLSMDMNLSSPYLLPPDVQQSRDSLNSLAKSLHGGEADPYRHIETFISSDAASMRSFPKGGDSLESSYTGTTVAPGSGRNTPSKLSAQALPRQKSFPTAPLPEAPTPTKEKDSARESSSPLSAPPTNVEFRFTDDDSTLPQIHPEPVDMPAMPEIQEPAPVAQRDGAGIVRPPSTDPASIARERNSFRDSSALPVMDLLHGPSDGLGIMDSRELPAVTVDQTPVSLRPGRKDGTPVVSEVPSVYEYHEESYAHYVDIQHDEDDDEPRGRQMRDNDQKAEDNAEPASLGVPKQDNKRLSVGLRPLPPSDYLESEDPEFRANRIRSFYKEYFDDSKEVRPPLPQPQAAQYVEDYDSGYMGDAAYFDPESNAFVMPYAQPVTRRAMTPPPSNRRPMPGPGPRQRGPPGPSAMGPGPRPRAGSMSGRFQGPPPRAGSAMSGRFHGPPPRAGSSMSGRFMAAPSPRPGSSASARGRGTPQPKRPLPPPAALNTLPTPSKLRDDSFAIFNSTDFAPPPTFKDQARGRSQSPMGERRPYQLNAPVASPLASSFDDMAALPSPHLLRKSSTFTGLDFAPPRRFKDPDSMSDAGSVVSMGSGISARANNAIHSGAGRVSRLPGDQIFTTAATANQLKPKWGMRD